MTICRTTGTGPGTSPPAPTSTCDTLTADLELSETDDLELSGTDDLELSETDDLALSGSSACGVCSETLDLLEDVELTERCELALDGRLLTALDGRRLKYLQINLYATVLFCIFPENLLNRSI